MCENTYFNNFSLCDPSELYNRTTNSLAEQIATVLTIFYVPCLVILGTIGNLISIYVFFSTKLRALSTSQYLFVLALSDTIFLLQLLQPWLSGIQISPLFNMPGFCQLFMYLSYVTSCLSAWLVVAFTIERLVAVLYPLMRNAWCTVWRARIIVIALTILAVLVNLPVLRFTVTKDRNCTINPEYMRFASRFNMTDTTVSFTIPLVVIFILNLWISVALWRLERGIRKLTRYEEPENGAVQRTTQARPFVGIRSQQRVTRMLLTVSSVFVMLNLPSYSMRIITYYAYLDSENRAQWDALQQVASMFFNTNFGINFYLYCLSGQNFRQELRNAIPCFRKKPRQKEDIIRMTAIKKVNRTRSTSASRVSNNMGAMGNDSVLVKMVKTPEGDPCLALHNVASNDDDPICIAPVHM